MISIPLILVPFDFKKRHQAKKPFPLILRVNAVAEITQYLIWLPSHLSSIFVDRHVNSVVLKQYKDCEAVRKSGDGSLSVYSNHSKLRALEIDDPQALTFGN